ncbi:hydrolase [Bacillus sp. JCM 19046]|nr:hydrolase [Bacillus sp. JCM 19045]GAF17023.1 hydrolase [Bacillus sp. JCM 19046]
MILHMTSSGSGEPIVFLHSGAETSQTDYQDQKDYFLEKYQVFMPDLSGHGQSRIGEYSTFLEFIQLTVEDLYQTLVYYKLSNVHIVASSSSAIVAVAFCNQYSQLVKSVTLTGLTPVKTDDWSRIFNDDLEHKKKILENPEADAYFRKLHVKSDWKKFVALVVHEDWYLHQLVSDLSRFSHIPTLIVSGEQVAPEITGLAFYKETYKHIHSAVIPFAGHLVHRDQPELFNAILEKFLLVQASKKEGEFQ